MEEDTDLEDFDGVTDGDNVVELPLHKAAAEGELATVRNLLQDPEANINEEDEDGNTPLHLAAEHGHLLVLRELVERGGLAEGALESLLRIAADNERLDVVKFLVNEYAVDVNFKDDLELRTLLHKAAEYGNLAVAKCLVGECRADVNVGDGHSHWTPLHFASANGHLNIVQYLIDNNADINALGFDEDNFQKGRVYTAIYYAVRNTHSEVALYLLQHGADYSGLDLSWLDGAKITKLIAQADLTPPQPELASTTAPLDRVARAKEPQDEMMSQLLWAVAENQNKGSCRGIAQTAFWKSVGEAPPSSRKISAPQVTLPYSVKKRERS